MELSDCLPRVPYDTVWTSGVFASKKSRSEVNFQVEKQSQNLKETDPNT